VAWETKAFFHKDIQKISMKKSQPIQPVDCAKRRSEKVSYQITTLHSQVWARDTKHKEEIIRLKNYVPLCL
jgi:hypothetical protein